MAKMKPETPLDYAVFQLSPKHSRCELFVSSYGSTEKLASGLLKPFVAHLQIAEEQVATASQSVKLEVGQRKNAETWFTKGTLEKFVRFVSTPEVLEMVNTFDAEISQLEAARRIYSQGAGDQLSGGGGSGVTITDDATKKELLRAIDVRLVAVRQDLSTACSRAAAAGFNVDTISQLQIFADTFGAHRLNEACGKFISLSERRPEVVHPWRSESENRLLRTSCESDMSIDDDPPSPPPHQEPTTSQQPNPPPVTFPLHRAFSRESSIEREDGNKPNDAVLVKDSKDKTLTPDQTVSILASQPGRRLSVQDRINMFENKQKETSGGKHVMVKPVVELRRLSSDVSSSGAAAAVEKAVLRRWSGASDMSIDLSAEKKDTGSPLCTPASAVVSQDKNVFNLNDNATEVPSGNKPQTNVLGGVNDSRLKGISFDNSALDSNKSNSNLDSGESDGLKDQVHGKTQSRSSINRTETENQESSEENFKTLNSNKNNGIVGFGNQGILKGSGSCEDLSGSQVQITGMKDRASSTIKSRPLVNKGGEQLAIPNQRKDIKLRDESAKQNRLKATQKTLVESGVLEGDAGSRIRKAFVSRYKGIQGDSSSAGLQARSGRETDVDEKRAYHRSEKMSSASVSSVEVRAAGENEIAGKKESPMPEKISSNKVPNIDDSGLQRPRFHKQGLTADLSKKAQLQRDESSFSGTSRTQFSGKVILESQGGSDSCSTPPQEQVQRVRQSKGNQELNDDLKMKADELEKLFAEHKLRVPGEQSNSARKGRPGDIQWEPSSSLHYTKAVADVTPQMSESYQSTESIMASKNLTKSNVASPMKTIDNQYYADAISNQFSEFSVSEGSRGKLYDTYMQKRDAKLKEDWSSNRAEKEARFKSMQDTLERNRAEMKAKISGSTDKQDSVSSVHRRAERLRSYNSRSIMKREQQNLDFGYCEDDEEALDFLEQNLLNENKALDDTSLRGGVSRSAPRKKHLPNNRNLSSSTPRASAAPVPRSATKNSTNYGKRRMPPGNPLAQSVPNFSDLRKENTKPSFGASKTTRSQGRKYARSKSTNEEAAIVMEDKSSRSQSLRKSSANPNDFSEITHLDSGCVVMAPIKFDDEIMKSVVTRPFLRKGSRASFVSQTSNAREEATVQPELVYEEENDDIESAPDEFVSMSGDANEEEFETFEIENSKILNGERKHGLELEKFVYSGSENDDGAITFTNVDQALGSQMPTVVPPTFLPVESVHEWPEESPASWNSHTKHPFACPHETSDVDASGDSPVGSPASWNSHSLNQIEADAARMRKKWGSAQKPMLVAHSSNNLPRKDMTRGFKRLLKFGRKSRGSESLVDWISATTSEGDDDTEDGRDPANRSSEDLRKSRMGFPHAHPSDDSFNEGEFFNESVQSSQNSIPASLPNFKVREDHIPGSSIKAPKSFFSLSTFRSKGSDSKPR